jgi:hypothetical protein
VREVELFRSNVESRSTAGLNSQRDRLTHRSRNGPPLGRPQPGPWQGRERTNEREIHTDTHTHHSYTRRTRLENESLDGRHDLPFYTKRFPHARAEVLLTLKTKNDQAQWLGKEEEERGYYVCCEPCVQTRFNASRCCCQGGCLFLTLHFSTSLLTSSSSLESFFQVVRE